MIAVRKHSQKIEGKKIRVKDRMRVRIALELGFAARVRVWKPWIEIRDDGLGIRDAGNSPLCAGNRLCLRRSMRQRSREEFQRKKTRERERERERERICVCVPATGPAGLEAADLWRPLNLFLFFLSRSV